MNTKEKVTNYETMKHISKVQDGIHKIVTLLLERGRVHDRSKLEDPELEYFTKYTNQLKSLTYGSPEYYQCLEDMKPAIEHHYANNRHHPEHYKNGINGMNLVDLIELLCDWSASAKRQHNGNLRISLQKGAERFNIEPQLLEILENTLELLDE
jgi:hypothetical protein